MIRQYKTKIYCMYIYIYRQYIYIYMQKLSDGSAKADMLAAKDSGKSLAQCFLANKKDGAQVPKGLQGACR